MSDAGSADEAGGAAAGEAGSEAIVAGLGGLVPARNGFAGPELALFAWLVFGILVPFLCKCSCFKEVLVLLDGCQDFFFFALTIFSIFHLEPPRLSSPCKHSAQRSCVRCHRRPSRALSLFR